MFCPKCGSENIDTTKFCVKCGTRMIRAEPEAARPETAVSSPVPISPSPTISVSQPGRVRLVVGWFLSATGVLGLIGLPPSLGNPGGGIRFVVGIVFGLGFLAGGVLLARGRGKVAGVAIGLSLLVSLAIAMLGSRH